MEVWFGVHATAHHEQKRNFARGNDFFGKRTRTERNEDDFVRFFQPFGELYYRNRTRFGCEKIAHSVLAVDGRQVGERLFLFSRVHDPNAVKAALVPREQRLPVAVRDVFFAADRHNVHAVARLAVVENERGSSRVVQSVVAHKHVFFTHDRPPQV